MEYRSLFFSVHIGFENEALLYVFYNKSIRNLSNVPKFIFIM